MMAMNWKRVRDQKMIREHGAEYYDVVQSRYMYVDGTKNDSPTSEVLKKPRMPKTPRLKCDQNPIPQKTLDDRQVHVYELPEYVKERIKRYSEHKSEIEKGNIRILNEIINNASIVNRCMAKNDKDSRKMKSLIEFKKMDTLSFTRFILEFLDSGKQFPMTYRQLIKLVSSN